MNSPMRVLICPDKFKGSLSAVEVSEAIAEGIRRVCPDAELELAPIADGGEGTVDAFCCALGGKIVECPAHDPLGRMVTAYFGSLPDGSAVIELPAASGFRLIKPEDRAPLQSNTFGTGEVMLAAIHSGARRLIVGLGGSATNDAGTGMAAALGFHFLDAAGAPVHPIPAAFMRITRIVPPTHLALPPVQVLCDVTNPLTGPEGATFVYGPQKGVKPEECEALDRALAHIAELVRRDLGCDFAAKPGAGAAGGMGFGLMSFARAVPRGGFETVAEITNLAEKIVWSDVVITGEGRLDRQSLSGKGPWGVGQMARKAGKSSICIAGHASNDPEVLAAFDHVGALVQPGVSVEEAMAHGRELIRERVASCLRTGFEKTYR